MNDKLCPFAATLVQHDFACPHAAQIIRRGGAEIACDAEPLHVTCCTVHGHIKQAALQAMGLEDDLLSVPHSQLVKIQFGGLLGLQRHLGDTSATVTDIAALIMRASQVFASMSDYPMRGIIDSIEHHKLNRRSRK
jgi:hypothetical protein